MGGNISADIVKSKVVISGSMVEVYEYGRGYAVGLEGAKIVPVGRTQERSDNYTLNQKKSAYRARSSLRRLINANTGQYGDHCSTKFLTLTFADDVQDIPAANYEFKKFKQRLNYHLFKTKEENLRYVAVPEFTEKGRVHYHVVLFNVPYIRSKDLAEVWQNGFIKLNRCHDVTNLGAYVSKYMTKETDSRLVGKKRYFRSRNLFKPEELTNGKADAFYKHLPLENKVYEQTFENDYLGPIIYKQYIIPGQKVYRGERDE